MSKGLNKVQLIGHLGRDPEIRYMPSGEAFASASIAVSEQWKDKSGERQERTEWVNLTFFGRLAEVVGEYLKKGSKVYVEGRMRTEKYTDKQGVEKYATKVVVNHMLMLDSRSESTGRGDLRSTEEREPAKHDEVVDDLNDDVPF